MRHRQASRGFTLIEVLVAITIVVLGLLGLAGMQARAQVAELESYQRAQALVILYDMMDKMQNNRQAASCFVNSSGTYYGDTSAAPSLTCSASTAANNALAAAAMTEVHNQLQGAGETKSSVKVGAMVGARACVTYASATEYLNAATGIAYGGTGEYTLMVSWQGMVDTYTPTKTCGTAAQYGTDTKRRTVWATMRVGTLAAQ